MFRFAIIMTTSVAVFGVVSPATAMDFDELFSAPDSLKTELLCRGYTTDTPVDGQVCGTDFAPLQRKAIADICFRPREDSAKQALARIQYTKSFWQDFTKATEFALSQGLNHGQLLAMPITGSIDNMPPRALRFMQQYGFAPSATAFAGFQGLAGAPDATFAASQPLMRDGLAYPFPSQLPVAFADFKFPSDNIHKPNNVVPGNFPRQPLCGEEDYNEHGEIRAAGDPKPLLNSEFPSVIAIFEQNEKIGSGVLIAENLALTAAHVLAGLEGEELLFAATGLIVDHRVGPRIEDFVLLNTTELRLDLAVVLLETPVTQEEAGVTPLLKLVPTNDLNDTEAVTAGYGNRENDEIIDGFEENFATLINAALPDDLSKVRRTSRVMRMDRCTGEAEHVECGTRAELFHYEAMQQDGAKMPFTSCDGDSGSPVFVQTEGPTGQLVVSAIFSIAGGQLQTGGCAQRMYFTDVTAEATQDAIREAVKELNPNFDTDSLFESGKLRRFGRIIDLAASDR